MKKYIKKHLKDEKRILKLMYKKGIFELLHINLKDLGWEYLTAGRKQRKRNGDRFKYRDYLPELHVYSVDYWGEGESNGVVEYFKSYLFWETAEDIDVESGWPINSMKLDNKNIILYLNKMPTVKNDSKFNKYLKNNGEQ